MGFVRNSEYANYNVSLRMTEKSRLLFHTLNSLKNYEKKQSVWFFIFLSVAHVFFPSLINHTVYGSILHTAIFGAQMFVADYFTEAQCLW